MDTDKTKDTQPKTELATPEASPAPTPPAAPSESDASAPETSPAPTPPAAPPANDASAPEANQPPTSESVSFVTKPEEPQKDSSSDLGRLLSAAESETPTPKTNPFETAEKTQQKKTTKTLAFLLLVLLIIVGTAAAMYYFFIYKPEQERLERQAQPSSSIQPQNQNADPSGDYDESEEELIEDAAENEVDITETDGSTTTEQTVVDPELKQEVTSDTTNSATNTNSNNSSNSSASTDKSTNLVQNGAE